MFIIFNKYINFFNKILILVFVLVVIENCSINPFRSVTTPPPSSSGNSPTTLYDTFGIGLNLGPHFQDNAYNAIYQVYAPNDLAQLTSAGFKTFRLYSDNLQVYTTFINWIYDYNQLNPTTPVHLVYQYSLCKSDAYSGTGLGTSKCIDIPKNASGNYVTTQDIMTSENLKLTTVINSVGVTKFQQVVPLMIVGNEVLIVSHGFRYNSPAPIACSQSDSCYKSTPKYNDSDIIYGIQNVKNILANFQGLSSIKLSSDFVVLNPKYVSDNFILPAFKNILMNSTGPVLMNIYPYQFGAGKADGTDAVFTADPYSLSSLVNGILNTTDQDIKNYITQNGFMIGETGWANSGIDPQYLKQIIGTPQGTENYIKDVITFVSNNKIPILIFEAYDQPFKNPDPNDAENHYGLLSINNDPIVNIQNSTAGINLLKSASGPTNNKYFMNPKTDSFIFNPAENLSGTITWTGKNGTVQSIPFKGPIPSGAIHIAMGDTVVIKEDCGNSKILSCSAKYITSGTPAVLQLVPDDASVCGNMYVSGINWATSVNGNLGLAAPAASACK